MSLRAEVIAGARRLLDERLVIGTAGNVSAREDDRLWMTPTRTPYRTLREADLAAVEIATGRPLAEPPPSRELPLHLAVYRSRPDAGAVVHTHSAQATAWSFLEAPLEPETEDLAYHGVGAVRSCGRHPAGSDALAAAVAGALSAANAVLLTGHGVVAVAADVDTAVTRAAVVEHAATIAWLLRRGG